MLVARGALRAAFQPIVSIRSGETWGVEALTRATDDATGAPIPPPILFAEAEEAGLLGPLDRYCRRTAVESFDAGRAGREVVLSLNWDVRTLASVEDDPTQFRRLVERHGLAPERVALEVLEGRAEDVDALVRFVEARKREGFLIAVDDYGAGHATAERLVRLEPDIVKIDRALVQGVSRSVPRRETCRSIAELARSIGAVVVAEGIESEEDLVEVVMMGIDLVQGYLLARPQLDLGAAMGEAEEAVALRRGTLRARAQQELVRRRRVRIAHEAIVNDVLERLRSCTIAMLDVAAGDALGALDGIEALYVLDDHGVQLTSTFIAESSPRKKGFRPTGRGTDLALKDYFLEVAHGEGGYVSRPYVSMASGRACVTHSRRLRLADDTVIVVCCDLPEAAGAA